MTWHATYPRITWTWDSCGSARCRGVLSGREPPRTALTISTCDTTWVSESKPPIWGSGSCHDSVFISIVCVDSNAISLEYGVENECVGHIYKRGTFQQTWGPPLPGVRRLCSHGSLCGTFMAELSDFTNWTYAEARSIRVLSPARHPVFRVCCPLVLRTTRCKMGTLRPGKPPRL